MMNKSQSLKVCANISLLFKEFPLLDRFQKAKQAGFHAVEIQFPYEIELERLLKAKEQSGLEVILINLPAGDLLTGGEGLAGVPERKEQFESALQQGLHYAKALDVKCVNVLAGCCINRNPARNRQEEYLETFHHNLKLTADTLYPLGITTTFEAVNTADMPGFLIHSVEHMQTTLEKLQHPGLAMQYDIYHMTQMGEPVQQQLDTLAEEIGHIQFADYPGRGEPGTGELDFKQLFDTIIQSNYRGWVGAEYNPSKSTATSLSWMALD